jgi:putative peptidoglycan lipid II flippase
VIFEIVAGGALASLVVPLLAGPAARGDRAAVSATASALLTWTLTLLVPLAAVVAAAAGPLVGLLSADASPAEVDTGVRMLRVFSPQLPLYGVGIVLTGVLQAHHRFAWPVLAPLFSSVTVIGAYLTFAAVEGPGADLPAVGRTGELILAVGTTLGVVVLALCLVLPVRRLGLRWRPGYGLTGHARRTVGGLAAAGAATVAGQQVAMVVALNRGWAGPEGTVVHYTLAQAVYLLPWAVLAVPLATAAYPTMAAAWTERDRDRYADTLAGAARGVLLLSFLGAAALVAVARPAADLLLPDAPGGGALAAAVVGFAPGLLGYGLFALLSRALYARAATRLAAAATLAGWAAAALGAAGLAAALPRADRALALALGNSIGMLALGGLLVAAVVRRVGRDGLAGLGRVALVGAAAAAPAAAAGWAVAWLAGHGTDGTPTVVAAVVQGMLSGGAVVAVFLGVAYPFDRRDIGPMLSGVRRRLRPAAGRSEG